MISDDEGMTGRAYQVVRLITRLNIGGPARQALLLTKELSTTHATLLGAGFPASEEGELSDPDVAVHRLPLVRPVQPGTDLRAFRKTRGLLQRVHPKILHTHMAKAGTIGRLAARGSAIRTVHTYHGHVLGGYFSRPVERAFLETEKRLARGTDVLVAISPEIRDELLDLGVGRPGQYEVIPLGFDLSRHLAVTGPSGALRMRLRLPASSPLIGTVARLVPIKDLGTLLRAICLLPDVHLAVLGDGEQRGFLEELARELRVEGRVHFLGWWKDIPTAMSDLDAVVLTSLNEGTPVSLIEALACQRPVVATDVGGVRFVVNDGRTGLVVPPRDPATVATAVRRLLDAPVLAAELAANGRASVEGRFDKRRLLSDVTTLYDGLARGRTT